METPRNPRPIDCITFVAAPRRNQGKVCHLAGYQQFFMSPALDPVTVGIAAGVWGLLGAAVLMGSHRLCNFVGLFAEELTSGL